MPRWTIVLCVRVCVWGSAGELGDPVCGLSSPIRYAVATWGNSFSIRRSKLAKKKKCFYDFGVFTVGCNVENEADTIASGHGMLLRAPRSISIIVRHFQLAIQIYHHSLSLSIPLSFSYALGLLLIEFFTYWHLFVLETLQSRFRRITRSCPRFPLSFPPFVLLHTNADKLVGQLKVFLSFLLHLNRVVLHLFPSCWRSQ